jgi:hypothetical protein
MLSALKTCLAAIRSVSRQKGELHEKPIREAYLVAFEAVRIAEEGHGTTVTLSDSETKEARDTLRQIEADYRHAANRPSDDDAATNNIRFLMGKLGGVI